MPPGECLQSDNTGTTRYEGDDSASLSCTHLSFADHITRPAAPAHPGDVEVRRVTFGSGPIDQEVAAASGEPLDHWQTDFWWESPSTTKPRYRVRSLPDSSCGMLGTGAAPSSRDANNATKTPSAWLAVGSDDGSFQRFFHSPMESRCLRAKRYAS